MFHTTVKLLRSHTKMAYTEKGAVEPLLKGETIEVRGVGNSMTPKLKSGDIVTVEPITPETELKKGDVVLVKVNGRVYLHLIKAFTAEEVLIGNNHGHVNGWTKKENVYGKVRT